MRPPQRRGGNSRIFPFSHRDMESFNEAPPKAGGKCGRLRLGRLPASRFNEAPPKAGGKFCVGGYPFFGRAASMRPPQRRGGNEPTQASILSSSGSFNEAPPKAGGK